MEVTMLKGGPAGGGVGSALLAACVAAARAANLGRLVLVSTNDNVDGLRFYQRRGFRLVALRPDAIANARRDLKRGIPEVGDHGIPIRDELELELPRSEWDAVIDAYGR
jgi:ribosomal protein S18 acetylase RimI-like enzyme